MKALTDGDCSDCRWRSVPGYAGVYLVSDTGLIFSEARTEFVQSKRTGGHYRFRNAGMKKTRINNLGYEQVSLNLDGDVKLHLVHRLVAQAFLPNPNNFPEVNHIDGNKSNNILSNLEWTTRQGNALHGTRVLGKNRGETHSNTKLTKDDVILIMGLLNSGWTQTEISKLFDVTNHAIYRIEHGFNWTWLTGYSRKEVVCPTV